MWILNNALAVFLAVVLGCFGHPILGVIVVLLLWCIPSSKNKTDDVEEVEYEVHDADD